MKSSYMTRALQSADPRYARILSKLGYGDAGDTPAAPKDEPKVEAQGATGADELRDLRAEYERVVGKKPFHGWGADKLREKITAAKA